MVLKSTERKLVKNSSWRKWKILSPGGLVSAIEPLYPNPKDAWRRPIGIERMLRIYCLQHWFNLSDPAAEEAIYGSLAMRNFVGIDLGNEPAPNETTICKFRHLMEKSNLGDHFFHLVNEYLHEIDHSSQNSGIDLPVPFDNCDTMDLKRSVNLLSLKVLPDNSSGNQSFINCDSRNYTLTQILWVIKWLLHRLQLSVLTTVSIP